MKKFFYLFFIYFAFVSTAAAKNVLVQSLDDFTKNDIEKVFQAQVLEQETINSSLTLPENSIIKGKIIKVEEAKRGKRNAYIIIKPETIENGENVIKIENSCLEAKVVGYSKKDFKQTALKAGLTAGGFFVKGLGQVFYFSKGLILPDSDKSRLSSAAHNVYENTPFVYIEKGDEIDIDNGDLLVLKFYHSDIPKWKVLKRNN